MASEIRLTTRRTLAVAATALLLGLSRSSPAQLPGMPEQERMMEWGKTLFVLFDQLEYSPGAAGRPVNLDGRAWYGGAISRLWVLLQGEGATTERDGEGDLQVMYGRLIHPFWDAVAGVRVDRQWGSAAASRVHLAMGLIGLAPYRFEFSPTLFVSTEGDISARVEAGYQILITQRLIAEPEFELNAALQAVPAAGIRRGVNDYEYGLRIRYEIRREFAPYAGWSFSRRSAALPDGSPEGEHRRGSRLVFGLRVWR